MSETASELENSFSLPLPLRSYAVRYLTLLHPLHCYDADECIPALLRDSTVRKKLRCMMPPSLPLFTWHMLLVAVVSLH